jgi:hypothetical protein
LHEQFVSYVAAVTIAGDRAGNLDTSMMLVAFSSGELKVVIVSCICLVL